MGDTEKIPRPLPAARPFDQDALDAVGETADRVTLDMEEARARVAGSKETARTVIGALRVIGPVGAKALSAAIGIPGAGPIVEAVMTMGLDSLEDDL